MSLREVARRLSVSPSFISQMENGKSKPSVATLYSLSLLLGVSIDGLFGKGGKVVSPFAAGSSEPTPCVNRPSVPVSPAFASLQVGSGVRAAIVDPARWSRLGRESAVAWESLAPDADRNLDFMEVTYPPGSSSTNDGSMVTHEGREYGYLLSGTLQITLGLEMYVLNAGESLSFDPAIPHLLANPGKVPARGIWVVHRCAPASEPHA